MSNRNLVSRGAGTVPCFLKKVSVCQDRDSTLVRAVNNIYHIFSAALPW